MMDVVGDGGDFLGLFGVIRNGASNAHFQDLPAWREQLEEVSLFRRLGYVAHKHGSIIVSGILG